MTLPALMIKSILPVILNFRICPDHAVNAYLSNYGILPAFEERVLTAASQLIDLIVGANR